MLLPRVSSPCRSLDFLRGAHTRLSRYLEQIKLDASSSLPLPLYFATAG